jgi:hypothetical protein
VVRDDDDRARLGDAPKIGGVEAQLDVQMVEDPSDERLSGDARRPGAVDTV